MFASWLAVVALALVGNAPASSAARALSVDARVDALLSTMSLDAMLGQMTQLDVSTVVGKDGSLNLAAAREHARLGVGSYLNTPSLDAAANETVAPCMTATQWRGVLDGLQRVFVDEAGAPPVLYGLDSVHGANYVRGAVSFGQQLNAAAAFNATLTEQVGAITARDTLAAGVPWVFAPILDVSQTALWARTYETFGEDPHVASVMAAAIVRGLQQGGQTAACMKHLIGYSKTPTGHDRDGVSISDYDLLNYFAPPFLAAIGAGVRSGMETYAALDGVPVVANTRVLEQLVRHDMGFDGLLVTDWAEINNLHDWHRVAKTRQDAVRLALQRTTLDLSMEPFDAAGFLSSAKAAVAAHPELLPRVRQSARRVLKLKAQLGLLDTPVPGAALVHEVGQASDREVALNLARESIVLAKNARNTLPLAPGAPGVFLTGHAADSVGLLCGGWTVRWQGVSTLADAVLFPEGVTLRRGLSNALGREVDFANALSVNGSYSREALELVKARARAAAVTVVAVGEDTYAEKPGDVDDLALPAGQVEYVRELASTGTKLVLVLVQGRPRLLQGLAELADAVVLAMLPGEVGGQALAEVLVGAVNPSGKLPITYPKDAANVAIPYYHRVTTRCADGPCRVEWPFGHGLSYASFEYGPVALEAPQVRAGGSQRVTVSVTNTGRVAGQETVLLFLVQPFRELAVPETKMLKRFRKLLLQPGETAEVAFELSADDWGVYDPQIGRGFRRVVEQGDYVVAIGADTDCDVYAGEAAATPPTLGDEAGVAAAAAPKTPSPLRNPHLCARFSITDSIPA